MTMSKAHRARRPARRRELISRATDKNGSRTKFAADIRTADLSERGHAAAHAMLAYGRFPDLDVLRSLTEFQLSEITHYYHEDI